jgi:hemolysin III
MRKTIPTYYAPEEERLNIWTHATGFILSFVALFFLIQSATQYGTVWHWAGYLTYGLSQLLVFGTSTLYHSAKEDKNRRKLNVLDHAAIYISIAGSYTPFTLIVIRDTWGWPVFGVVWGIALTGIVIKIFFTGRFKLLSTLSYLVMGWVMIVAIKPLIHNLPLAGLLWIAGGGLLYTLGAILYQMKRIPFNHAVFHFFVLAAAVCHFIAVYVYAI